MVRIKPFRDPSPCRACRRGGIASLRRVELGQRSRRLPKSRCCILSNPKSTFRRSRTSIPTYARAVENFRAWREKDGSCKTIRKNIMFMPRRWTAGRSTDWWRPCHFDDYLQGKSKARTDTPGQGRGPDGMSAIKECEYRAGVFSTLPSGRWI